MHLASQKGDVVLNAGGCFERLLAPLVVHGQVVHQNHLHLHRHPAFTDHLPALMEHFQTLPKYPFGLLPLPLFHSLHSFLVLAAEHFFELLLGVNACGGVDGCGGVGVVEL